MLPGEYGLSFENSASFAVTCASSLTAFKPCALRPTTFGGTTRSIRVGRMSTMLSSIRVWSTPISEFTSNSGRLPPDSDCGIVAVSPPKLATKVSSLLGLVNRPLACGTGFRMIPGWGLVWRRVSRGVGCA